MNILDEITKEYMEKEIADFRVGDTVRVYYKVVEGGKQRIQPYEGVVIAKNNSNISKTFTVRKISYGVGVERVFPLYSPNIEKVEIKKRGKVRRAKLYYLRQLRGKKAKIKERR